MSRQQNDGEMTRSRRRIRAQLGSAVARWTRVTVTLVASVAVIVTTFAAPASAYWTSTGTGSTTATTGTLSAPTGVTVPGAAAPDVPVSWTAGTGGVTPTGYFVTRNDGTDTEAACASSPTDLIAGPTCTDMSVRDGTFTYIVTAVYASWTAASEPSGFVTVENAAYLEFVSQPTETVADAIITPAVTVALRTADGGPFLSAGVEVNLSINHGPLSGTLMVLTDANGVATFDNLAISEPGEGYILRAQSADLTDGTSDAFTVSVPPLLGAAQSFSILAYAAVTNTGTSSVSGDVGVSPGPPGTIGGFTTGQVGGDIHLLDSTAAAAQTALVTAYADLSTRTADQEITILSGTFLPGVYHSGGALSLTSTVTLDANNDPDAVFIFQINGALNTAATSNVILTEGARAANVYWVVNGAAGTGANATLSGSILAVGAITLGAGTLLIGRGLSRAAVTLDGSTIRFTAALPPTITITGGPTFTTKITTPTIAGTSNAPVGSPVTVTIAGQTLSTTVVSGGTWSVTATVLAAGSYPVVAKVRDPAGNGTAASQVLTVEVNPAPVNLGAAASFAVLANPSVTNTDASVVNGDLGVSPGATVTGFPPGVVNGTSHLNDTEAGNAQNALAAAITEVSARTKHTEITADLGGQTFHLGIHHQTAAMALTGTVTLDAEDNPDAIFIFVTDAAFNTAEDSVVVLANGAQAANVYWVVGDAAGTGAGSTLSGTILATGAITLGAGTQLAGRALSRAAVTMAGSTITVPVVAGLARRAAAMVATTSSASTSSAPPSSTSPPSAPSTTDQTPASTTGGASGAVTSTETATATAATPPAETPPGTTPSTSSPNQTPPEPMPETTTATTTATTPATTAVSTARDTSPEATAGPPQSSPPVSGTTPGPTTSTTSSSTGVTTP